MNDILLIIKTWYFSNLETNFKELVNEYLIMGDSVHITTVSTAFKMFRLYLLLKDNTP